MDWYSQLDTSKLDPETKLRVLCYAIEKHEQKRVTEALGTSRYTLNRYLNARLEVPNERFLSLSSSLKGLSLGASLSGWSLPLTGLGRWRFYAKAAA